MLLSFSLETKIVSAAAGTARIAAAKPANAAKVHLILILPK
jgi:hypothetical protein